MSSYDNHQALAGLTLGKSTDYRDTYDASLLQGVPRSLNRDPLGLHADNLPFHGADIWTLYELSWLNGKGLPQVAVGHVELPDTSLNLVESKSFKLYLNSFNQTRFASWQDVAETLTRDLSACAQGRLRYRSTAWMNWKASRLPACTAPASTIRISRLITISSAPITCRAPPAAKSWRRRWSATC